MSLFTYSDYSKPKETVKKVKLPTQEKSKSCSLCEEIAVKVIVIGNEKRSLCKKHHQDYLRKDLSYSVRFEKASDC